MEFKDQNHPPGTVQLLERRDSVTSEELVLVPAPSSDPNDPLRWSAWRKGWNFALLIAMTMVIFTGVSTQSIFIAQLRKELHAKNEDLVQSIAVEHAGEAIGCIFLVPFATKYGRRPVYIASVIIYSAAAWWFSRMTTVTDLYASNAVKGFAIAVNETAVQMSIRDMFFLHTRSSASALYHFGLATAFSLVPTLAGTQALNFGWRASATTQAGVATALIVLFLFTFEETKFVRKDDKLSRQDSEKDSTNISIMQVGEEDLPPTRKSFPYNLRLQMVTPTEESLWKIFVSPIYSAWLPHVIFTGLVFGSGLMWCVSPLVGLQKVFALTYKNFNPQQLGLLYLAMFVGSIFGSIYGGTFVDKATVWLAKRNGGLYEPEKRLYMLPPGALCMSVGLIVFGVGCDQGMHWIVPCIGSGLMAGGFGIMAAISFIMVVDSYPKIIGNAFIVIAIFRNILAVVGPSVVLPWIKRTGMTNMFITASAINLGINLLGVPLVIWGKQIRRKTARQYYRLADRSI